MKKPELKDFTTKNAEGVETTNYTDYAKAMESYADARANEAAETAKQKGILEGKTKAEEEAKLSVEEKIAKALKERQDQISKRELELNQREFSSNLKAGGFADDEITVIIGLCGNDGEKNKATIDKLISARKIANETLEKQIKSGIQGGQPNPDGGDGKTKGNENNYGKILGEKVAAETKKNEGSFDSYKIG